MVIDAKYALAQQRPTALLSPLTEMYCLFISISPAPLFPVSGSHYCTHRVYKRDYFRYRLWMQSGWFYLSVTGSSHPTQGLQSSSTLLHIPTLLYIRLSCAPLCSAPSSVNPHLQCFQLAVVDDDVMVVRWQYLFDILILNDQQEQVVNKTQKK